MPSVLARLTLFLSSYAPLVIIVAILHRGNRPLALLLAAGASASAIGLFAFVHALGSLNPLTIGIQRATRKDSEVTGYLMAYLFPFLGVDLTDPSERLAFAVLFALVAALYVRSNLIYVNPLLAIARFNLFEVELDNGRVLMLLSKAGYHRSGSRIRVAMAGSFVALERPDE